MKKILAFILVVTMCVGVSAARDRVTTDVNVLPQTAQTFIKKHFGNAGINHIKVDDNFIGGDEYDVVLNNGAEVDFDSKGDWKEVECGRAGVPASIVLPEIAKYLARNYKGAKISSVSKKRNKYEVELTNGLDLEFTRSGAFLRLDD